MLSFLSFKKSLFARALDVAQDEVLMGGARLNKFIESVD